MKQMAIKAAGYTYSTSLVYVLRGPAAAYKIDVCFIKMKKETKLVNLYILKFLILLILSRFPDVG